MNNIENNTDRTKPFKPMVLTTSTPLRTHTAKGLHLSDFTMVELNRLCEEYDTNTSTIEWAVSHFSYRRKKGE